MSVDIFIKSHLIVLFFSTLLIVAWWIYWKNWEKSKVSFRKTILLFFTIILSLIFVLLGKHYFFIISGGISTGNDILATLTILVATLFCVFLGFYYVKKKNQRRKT